MQGLWHQMQQQVYFYFLSSCTEPNTGQASYDVVMVGAQKEEVPGFIWVVVKIVVAFWVSKKGPYF